MAASWVLGLQVCPETISKAESLCSRHIVSTLSALAIVSPDTLENHSGLSQDWAGFVNRDCRCVQYQNQHRALCPSELPGGGCWDQGTSTEEEGAASSKVELMTSSHRELTRNARTFHLIFRLVSGMVLQS